MVDEQSKNNLKKFGNTLSDELLYKIGTFSFNEMIGLNDWFITSDLHFNHSNSMKWHSNTRKFTSLKDMNESLINEWNKVVPKDGKVIHTGDFRFKSGEPGALTLDEIISRLNGTIYFIYGNHDEYLRQSVPGCDVAHLWNNKLCSDGKHRKQRLVLSHFPFSSWDRSNYGGILLHGHEHGTLNSLDNSSGSILDCGWDNHGKILTLREAIRLAELNNKSPRT